MNKPNTLVKPWRGCIEQLIWERKILKQSKDTLRNHPEEYRF
jgi:hypothetical protein